MKTEIDPTFRLITRLPARPARGAMANTVIATRHEIVGAGIEAVLQAAGHSVVARCSREDDLLRSLEAYRPDILILAQNIVRQEGRETVLQLRASNCSVRIIFLLDERDATTTNLLDVHVEAILLSATCARSLIECVASVHQGRKWIDPQLLRELATAEQANAGGLTPREADVAYRVAQGLSNKEIARELHLSEGTVKMHLHHIYGKLRLGGRTQLALAMAETCARIPVSGNEACPLGDRLCRSVRIPPPSRRLLRSLCGAVLFHRYVFIDADPSITEYIHQCMTIGI
jgi:two-component system, NarL family, nitrate/nitrite response regulator NarL